jgi:hypothetical protein
MHGILRSGLDGEKHRAAPRAYCRETKGSNSKLGDMGHSPCLGLRISMPCLGAYNISPTLAFHLCAVSFLKPVQPIPASALETNAVSQKTTDTTTTTPGTGLTDGVTMSDSMTVGNPEVDVRTAIFQLTLQESISFNSHVSTNDCDSASFELVTLDASAPATQASASSDTTSLRRQESDEERYPASAADFGLKSYQDNHCSLPVIYSGSYHLYL